MKSILRSITTCASIFLIVGIYPHSSNAQIADPAITQHLLKLEQDLNIGVRKHDTTALKEIVLNEFQLTGPQHPGATRRQQWLINCLKISHDSVNIDHVTVSNWGEVAVFRSLQHFHNLIVNGQPGPYNDAWVTDLWMKRNGTWQLVTRVSERLPKR
jgi:hypothetical protein